LTLGRVRVPLVRPGPVDEDAMAEMLTPLAWDTPAAAKRAPGPAAADKIGREEFLWPAPPFASYPPPAPQADPLPCEIAGLNDKLMAGRLTFFVPEEAVAHVQVPPARTTLPLRFDQFRSLTLTTPLAPLPAQPDEPHASLLGPCMPTSFRVALAGGGELTGETIGHVESAHGLFLFPPHGDQGLVRRQFVPRVAYTSVEVGPRIGELLVEQRAATPQQVAQAIDAQQELRRQKLGDILLTRRVVSPEQLLEAIERQARMPMVRIGEALTSLGLISPAQLAEALEQQQADRNVPLGELLVRMGVVSRADLQVALARKMGYPLVDIDAFPIEADALRKLPYAVALRLQVMPLLLRDGRLVVALDDPARRRVVVEEAEFVAQTKVVPVLAQCRDMEQALALAYEKLGQGNPWTSAPGTLAPIAFELDTDKLVESLVEKDQQGRAAADDEAPIEQSDNSLVRLINNMIVEAHKDGVSDIHIESYPGREKIRIRFRKDGLLRTYLELPANYRNAMIARVKIMCDLDISEKRKPQDGKINFAKFSAQHRIELRVATIPTNSGLEDVVMRILASAKPIPLDRLGLSDHNLAELKKAVERPYGMVLCVGPTGSGKTTTLHSALSHINVPERKIWTAEDPIEITQPGLRQVQVNAKIDWTFAKALRAFLRADPDVIMVGEIRDEETAHTAIEASLTGHLVLSTLHTNSAPETVTRLLDMGMDPFNFADSLLGVLAQRLVRRLCGDCRTSRPAGDDEIDELLDDYMHAFGAADTPMGRETVRSGWLARHGHDGRLQHHHAPGCPRCDGTGFKGRAGLHELMVVSRGMRRLIQTGARAEALQELALREGMRTLRQDGIDKVLAGDTTIDEVRAISNA
jgi:type II secretory ATPase GspE/PulE/Tfp pilus assembly ATPase PilB-like protein